MINLRVLALSCVLLGGLSGDAQVPAAITSDPAVDKANPARNETFQIPSHGALLNGMMLEAAGAGPHPVVVLLHGFPGNEKNLDLAQAIRRAGWDVLYFNYRGSWGTPGDFSFQHSMEDAQAAVAYVRDADHARALRADPKTVVLVGHSMGGMIAAWVTAQDPQIRAAGLISAADMAARTQVPESMSAEDRKQVQAKVAAGLAKEGMAPLAGCTPESLAGELMAHAKEWSLAAQGAKMATRPVLVVTSDDGLAPADHGLVVALEAAGDQEVNEVHIATDHSYSDSRIALEAAVLAGLAYLTQN